MSLFGNLFSGGKAGGSLFSEKSKFRSKEDPIATAPLDSDSPPAQHQQRKRREQGAPAVEEPAKSAKKQKSAPAAKPSRPKGVEARQQAEKAAEAAKVLRQNAGEEGEEPAGAKKAARGRGKKAASDSDAVQSRESGGKTHDSNDEEKTRRKVGIEKLMKKAAKKAVDEVGEDVKEPKTASVEEIEEKSEGQEEKDDNDPQRLERTIFVGNLPAGTKPRALSTLFSAYDAVEAVRLRSVPLQADSKLPRRIAVSAGNADAFRASAHAYVVFKDKSAVAAALEHNMKEWKGRHLRVDRAAGPSGAVKVGALARTKAGQPDAGEGAEAGPAVHYDPSRSVFIGNLPIDVDDEELIRFFLVGAGGGSGKGGKGSGGVDLEAVRVVRDARTFQGKGIAFAMFKSRVGRKAALALDGRQLRGRPLRITQVVSGAGGSGAGATAKKRALESWQGATATKSGRSRGLPVKTQTRGLQKPQVLAMRGEKRTRDMTKRAEARAAIGRKRPAVAARKLKQLGKPKAAEVRKKKPRSVRVTTS